MRSLSVSVASGGSGFFIDGGYIVTNNHMVDNATVGPGGVMLPFRPASRRLESRSPCYWPGAPIGAGPRMPRARSRRNRVSAGYCRVSEVRFMIYWGMPGPLKSAPQQVEV